MYNWVERIGGSTQMATTMSVAQWHALQPAWYFRQGAPLDDVKAEFIRGTRGHEIVLSGLSRFANKLAFTAKCTVLDEPRRFGDDHSKNFLTVSLGGEELVTFIGQAHELIQKCVRDTDQVDPAKMNVFGETYITAKIAGAGQLRLWKNDQRIEGNFPKPTSEVVIMGVVKPYVMAGKWGSSVIIYQVQV